MLFTIVDICQLLYLYYKKLLTFKKRNWAIRFSSLSFLVLMVVYMSQSGFKRINYCYCKSNNLLSAVISHLEFMRCFRVSIENSINSIKIFAAIYHHCSISHFCCFSFVNVLAFIFTWLNFNREIAVVQLRSLSVVLL